MQKMPILLLCEIVLLLVLAPYLPIGVKASAYALSLSIKSIIIFLLPLVIFGLLFKTMVGLARKATWVIGLVLLCVVVSNSFTTYLSHFVGEAIYHLSFSMIKPSEVGGLTASWILSLPTLIANNKAMFLGISLGIFAGYALPGFANRLSDYLQRVIGFILSGLRYVIPIFIAGFVIKLQHDGVMQAIYQDYTLIFAIIALSQLIYLSFLYTCANGFNINAALMALRNMLPAAITGFSTMSSAAAMPTTIEAVRLNTKHKDVASSVIPVTVNIHLIGDCIAIPIFAYAVMKSFGVAEPTFIGYATFLMYFVIAKFSVAAIPGGGIIIMLPILESCLGFNADMLSLITALYILFDPVITCTNVLGNGAFAILIDKIIRHSAQIAPDLDPTVIEQEQPLSG